MHTLGLTLLIDPQSSRKKIKFLCFQGFCFECYISTTITMHKNVITMRWLLVVDEARRDIPGILSRYLRP